MADQDTPKVTENFHNHWWTVLIEGLILLVLGGVAIVIPFLAGLVVAVFVGWLLIIAGVLGLFTSFSMRAVKAHGWAALSSLIALLAGLAFIVWPVGGLISLTLVLGAYLTLDGITTIALALRHRRAHTGNWGWLLANGLLDLLLASWIIVLQPSIDAWILGVVVGVDLVFAGISLIAVGWAAKIHTVRINA